MLWLIIALSLLCSVLCDVMCPGADQPWYNQYPKADYCGGCQYCRSGDMCTECTQPVVLDFAPIVDGQCSDNTKCSGCSICSDGKVCSTCVSGFNPMGLCSDGTSCQSTQICSVDQKQSLCSVSALLQQYNCLETISFNNIDLAAVAAADNTKVTYRAQAGDNSVIAYGYKKTAVEATTGTLTAVSFKQTSGIGNGLGLEYQSEKVIDNTGFIQLDVSGISNSIAAQFVMASVIGGGRYAMYGSNTQGTIGVKLLDSSLTMNYFPYNFNQANYKFISITAITGKVLLSSFIAACPTCTDVEIPTYSVSPKKSVDLAVTTTSFFNGASKMTLYGYDKISAVQTVLYSNYVTNSTTPGDCNIGVGISSQQNHGISASQMIQLDISTYKSKANKISLSFCGTSAGNDYFQVYGSKALGIQGSTLLLEGAVANQYLEISGFRDYDFLSVTARSGGDILLKSVKICDITATATSAAASVKNLRRKLI